MNPIRNKTIIVQKSMLSVKSFIKKKQYVKKEFYRKILLKGQKAKVKPRVKKVTEKKLID